MLKCETAITGIVTIDISASTDKIFVSCFIYLQILNRLSNLPMALFFSLRAIFLGSLDASTSMSLAVLAALYRPLDAFLAILATYCSFPVRCLTP